ncbi:MAG TPA: AAA family ATPase [Ktedonobacteraceae bacterium]
MSVLRLNVLGPPEVFHDSSRLSFALRKAQALLLYLAVEGGLHPRGKLAALMWPDSEPADARKPLRNAITLLRSLLADADASAAHSHLLAEQDLLGLNPQAPLELDLEVVQQAYTAAQRHSTVPSESQRVTLVSQVQQALALVRGPFLDGFWLREETGFDQWHEQVQQQWQVRLLLLCERLCAWQEAGGELEQARATLTHWLALDPLSEEASRRLMRVHLTLGDATAALQIYATCRARLAEELRVKPSAETVALAEHIRATAARGGNPSAPPSTTMAVNQPPSELIAPLIGRAAAFSQLAGRYQQARGGRPQAVLVVGEAGIGKTRLAGEFVAWARAQGAEVLSGHALEMGGRLPYQPLVEALRTRLEAENAPEDLLEDVWLAELSRLLPELRVRYPDLPAPTEDELTAKMRLFEAVARLFDALAHRSPLVLLLDDLHWLDQATLDLLRYLGRYWKGQSSRVMLLGTVRGEGLELNPQLSSQLADLGRDLPVSQVTLQALGQAETLQLVEAIAGVGTQSTSNAGERREHGPDQASVAGTPPAQELETKLSALGKVLFAQTDGQPLYLLETLKLLRDRQWLVPRLSADGVFRLELAVELETIVAQERFQGALLPPSVRSLVLARLAPLSQAARQLVQVVAVLATGASAQLLWQVAEMGVQAGVEALEEAVKSGMLREEGAGGGRQGSYRFTHDLMRDVVYTELGVARRQVLHQRALARLETEGARASELAYHALASGETEAAYGYSVQAGMEAGAVFAVEDAIEHYQQARALLQEHQRIQTRLSALEVERLYVHLGQAYVFQNAWEKAQRAYEELLDYGKQHQLLTLVSRTLNHLAVLAVQQSQDKAKVRALLQEAWQMAQTSSDQRVVAETRWNRAQIIGVVWGEDFTSSLLDGQQALSLARARHDQELEARCLFTLGVIHLFRGDFEESMHCTEASLALYAALGGEPTASGELSLPSFAIGAPLTQPLTHRTSEALCWALLAIAQVHAGQVHSSVRSGRRALALAQESKSVWVQISSTTYLANGLLEAGAYEEALELIQPTLAQARTLPPTFIYQRFLTALGRTYHAVQQWDEARRTLAEADAMAETLDLGRFRVSPLSQLCMHCALAGEWGQASRYAVQASSLRKSFEYARILMDFSPQYETEALLREGDERQAREAVHRLGEGVGPYQRYRIPHLRSLAVLAAWEGHSGQAIGHLREAAQIAVDLGLPGEQWQIQAELGRLYEAEGLPKQARTAFGEAATIIHGLAEGMKDKTLRSRFLAGPQIQPVLQRAQRLADAIPDDHQRA